MGDRISNRLTSEKGFCGVPEEIGVVLVRGIGNGVFLPCLGDISFKIRVSVEESREAPSGITGQEASVV